MVSRVVTISYEGRLVSASCGSDGEPGEGAVVRGSIRLCSDRRVSDVGFDLRFPCALALVEERRDGDSGENADDEDDDEELDQGESLFVLFMPRSNGTVNSFDH